MNAEEEADLTKYLKDGVGIAQHMINEQLAPVLGEDPERWLGAGIMTVWLMEQIGERDNDIDNGETGARRIVLLLALVMRGFLEHPLAVAALRKHEANLL